MDKSSFNIEFQNNDLSSKIVSGLERVSEAFRVLLWDYAKENGLSPIQIQILIFIKYHDQALANVSSLAKEFNVTKPTISDVIKVLSKKGLIEKTKSTFDKRAYSISLSQAGEKIVIQTEHFAKPIKTITKELSKSEQIQFFSTLSKVIYGLNKAEILSVQRTCFSCRHYTKISNQHFCKLLNTNLLDHTIRIDCPEFKSKLD